MPGYDSTNDGGPPLNITAASTRAHSSLARATRRTLFLRSRALVIALLHSPFPSQTFTWTTTAGSPNPGTLPPASPSSSRRGLTPSALAPVLSTAAVRSLSLDFHQYLHVMHCMSPLMRRWAGGLMRKWVGGGVRFVMPSRVLIVPFWPFFCWLHARWCARTYCNPTSLGLNEIKAAHAAKSTNNGTIAR